MPLGSITGFECIINPTNVMFLLMKPWRNKKYIVSIPSLRAWNHRLYDLDNSFFQLNFPGKIPKEQDESEKGLDADEIGTVDIPRET